MRIEYFAVYESGVFGWRCGTVTRSDGNRVYFRRDDDGLEWWVSAKDEGTWWRVLA